MPVSAHNEPAAKITALFLFLTVLFFSSLSEYAFPSEIYDAVWGGDLQKVKEIIENDPSWVDFKSEKGWTLLHRATYNMQVDVAEYLLSKGADVNARTNDDQTPLSIAVERGGSKTRIYEINIIRRKRMINLLAAYRAQTNEIEEAIAQDNAEIFDAILKQRYDSNDFVDRYNLNLNCAAFWGSSKITVYLLKRIGELVRSSVDLEGPLHTAATLGYSEIVHLLVYSGADVNPRRGRYYLPLYDAVKSGNGEIFMVYYDPRLRKYRDFLWSAVYCRPENYIDIARILIVAGADVNARPDQGSYCSKPSKDLFPLQIAAMKGWTEMAKLLLSAGARSVINEKDDIWYYTPLHHAAEQGNKALVKVLLENGADIEIKDDQGRTPLRIAKEKGHKDIINLLRSRGANDESQ